MTVAELIAQLQQVDPSLEVIKATDLRIVRVTAVEVTYLEKINIGRLPLLPTEHFGRDALVL